MSIHIEQLKISTAEVQIKIATVSGRRMTKAVFNQVLPAPFWRLENADGFRLFKEGEIALKPNGTLLGYIHNSGEHWLLFQQGDYLRKCQLYKRYKTSNFWEGYYRLASSVDGLDEMVKGRGDKGEAVFIQAALTVIEYLKKAQEEQLFISI